MHVQYRTERQMVPPNQSEIALSPFFPEDQYCSGSINQWFISRYGQFPGRDHRRELLHARLSLCDKQQSLWRRVQQMTRAVLT